MTTGARPWTLTLTNPVGARIADGAATGTITNTGRIPQAWLARFGRTVADQVLDAVGERMRGGSASTRMTLGGREVLLDAEWPKEGDFLRGGVDPREGEHLFERKAADALASRAHSMGGTASREFVPPRLGGREGRRFPLVAVGPGGALELQRQGR